MVMVDDDTSTQQKGTVSCDFCLQFFFMNHVPLRAPDYSLSAIPIFLKIREDQGAPPVSATIFKIFSHKLIALHVKNIMKQYSVPVTKGKYVFKFFVVTLLGSSLY
jgi:hypothetical protein